MWNIEVKILIYQLVLCLLFDQEIKLNYMDVSIFKVTILFNFKIIDRRSVNLCHLSNSPHIDITFLFK